MEAKDNKKPCFCPHGNAVHHEHRWEELDRYPKATGATANSFVWCALFFALLAIASIVGIHRCGWWFATGLVYSVLGICTTMRDAVKRCCEKPMERHVIWKTMRCSICNLGKEEEVGSVVWRCVCCEKQTGNAAPDCDAPKHDAKDSGFLRNTGELTIRIPVLKRPTLAELQAKYPGIGIASIERDCSPMEKVTMNLATVLRIGETAAINGAEYERRLASCLNDSLGFQQLEWLVEHQDEFPVFMALLGKIYVDGPGIVVTDANGSRRSPYLSEGGRRWKLRWHWIGYDFSGGGRIASSRK